MVYPQNMVLVRWDFRWKGTEEIQSTSCWGQVFQEGAAVFPDWQPTVNAAAAKAVSAWHDSWAASNFSLGVEGVRAVAYHYDQAHNEVLDRGEAAFDGDNAWSSTAQSSLPPQNALVLSLYAYDPAGYTQQRARKRGRMYLPTISPAQIDGTGQVSVGQATTFANAGKAFMDAMQGQLDIDGEAPASQCRWRPMISSVAGQFANRVTFVRVGTVVDTHRSRRNQLTETYVNKQLSTT